MGVADACPQPAESRRIIPDEVLAMTARKESAPSRDLRRAPGVRHTNQPVLHFESERIHEPWSAQPNTGPFGGREYRGSINRQAATRRSAGPSYQ